ncbi:DUF2163 domain-containing protein [Cognatiyoonia sp. IB215446]|uniref:DUF2163 domain-containing protein n=1 Tax=Cognatiyoonia sp. IB215446 TaxID=3097355 RepID=UPI002A17D178|nr:DUF2163 domain-containing protein [Cognatiyoonia sp. IB215446]MDX8349664.1 DUF2163 domain-containing protein [Cognatiyoonia sp. IB215446]
MTEPALLAHLATGATHICHCWAVKRKDGLVLGFTDHDRALSFDGINFQPESGLTARALASTTGLSVNNSEAVGVLSSDAISDADIEAGRYDGALVEMWLVQWDDPDVHQLQFAGTLGEITRGSGGFEAELRGLSEALNQPRGRSYLKTCGAVLGDSRCGVDLNDPNFMVIRDLAAPTDGVEFRFADLSGFSEGWFQGGVLTIETGDGRGLSAMIREDLREGDMRVLRLWESIRSPVAVGDWVKITAGCDKRPATCREKFANFLNFQGFPDIPGDDWLVSVPRSDRPNRGGSRSR